MRLAEALNITSDELSIEDFSTAGGGRVSGYRVEKPLEVELVLEDREPVRASALVTVLPGETEVIISDRLGARHHNTGSLERLLVPLGRAGLKTAVQRLP